MDYERIRGFNYQPSYGSSGFELWQKFDAATIRLNSAAAKDTSPI